MKFLIKRTSIWDGQPCEEAKLESYVRVDERGVDEAAKIPAKLGESEWWYKEGKNHRVENGHIKRDFDAQEWFVEISSLDELIQFHKKHGNLVIQEAWSNPDLLQLEIYDDYRE